MADLPIRTAMISPYIFAQGKAVSQDPDMHGRISVQTGDRTRATGRPVEQRRAGDDGCDLVDGFMGMMCRTCGGDNYGGTLRCARIRSVVKGGAA